MSDKKENSRKIQINTINTTKDLNEMKFKKINFSLTHSKKKWKWKIPGPGTEAPQATQ